MSDSIRFVMCGLFASLVFCAGCSPEMNDAIVEAARAQSQPSKAKLGLANQDNEFEAAKPVNTVTMPSPERINPFEMSGEFEEAPVGESPGKKREIRVLGFIELDAPAAMLSLDGRTQTFKVGETFEKVTVHEIQPPRVRISYDGVTWQASLFDRRSN